MRYRALAIVLICLILVGCAFGPEKVRVETVYQEVKVPVSTVPMPPNTDCPTPRIEVLTDAQAAEDGEVAKAYRIAIEQLRDCSEIREAVINKYREIAAEDQRNLDDLEREANAAPPFGSAGPTADTANQTVITPPPIVTLDREQQVLQDEREDAFGELGAEFENLRDKEYDIQ